ncbi:MAG: multicopper oxidase domain-containing protein, partial [Pirellulaceae bacterium]
QEMGHPFHVHGARFRVVGPPAQAGRPENAGWKDTVLAEGEVELWVEFGPPATQEHPFMFHCHVLEHEDRGMMGQFVVLAKAAALVDPQFELVGPPVRIEAGRVRFGVRLTADGQALLDADISAVDFNMSPEGMDHSTGPIAVSRGDDGTQYFEVIPDMGGRWQVVLRGRVPGIDQVLAAKLTMDVPN